MRVAGRRERSPPRAIALLEFLELLDVAILRCLDDAVELTRSLINSAAISVTATLETMLAVLPLANIACSNAS